MSKTNETETNNEIDREESNYRKSLARLDANISFMCSILNSNEEIDYSLQKMIVSFDNEKHIYNLKLKNNGMTLETIASPSRESFNKWMKRFIKATRNQLNKERARQYEELTNYLSNRSEPLL